MEKEQLSKQIKDFRLDAHRRIDELERRNAELEGDNSSLNNQIKSSDITRLKTQDRDDKIRHLEMEKKNIEQQNKILEVQANKISDAKLDAERKTESLRREIDILQHDKSFLTRER